MGTCRYSVIVLLVSVVLQCVMPAFAATNPRNRIDFWQQNYDELRPKDSLLAARAHEVFERVLNAAGKRPGVVPRLFIVKNDTPYIPLAQAIPDGGIIISKKLLDICYKDSERGDDRLAFVLGHEIAHQLKDDFWHMIFFQAVELSRENEPENKNVLDEVKAIVGLTDKVLAKELQADEYGIIYASLAGFNTNAIVNEDDEVNFFEYLYQSMHPGNIKGIHKDPEHPTPTQRAETVKMRLKQVLEKVEVFNLGLLFYRAKDYQRATLCFQEFLRFFPSREVYHNLGASHHQLALKFFRNWKGDEIGIPFKLSVSIDPVSRATQITFREGTSNISEELFQKHIEEAIKYYKTAISHDPSYSLSHNNLGCALIAKGEYYAAIAQLQACLKIDPEFTEAINNLGAAFFMIENSSKAREYLNKARELDPGYDAPLFNLGKIFYIEENEDKAREYWSSYLSFGAEDPWSHIILNTLSLNRPENATPSFELRAERIMDVEPGDYDDEIPSKWGEPIKVSVLHLEEDPYRLCVYSNKVMTISQDDEILMITTTDGYMSENGKGIKVGSLIKDVGVQYGAPTTVQDTTQGMNWVYESLGIAFQIRGGKVVSWLVF